MWRDFWERDYQKEIIQCIVPVRSLLLRKHSTVWSCSWLLMSSQRSGFSFSTASFEMALCRKHRVVNVAQRNVEFVFRDARRELINVGLPESFKRSILCMGPGKSEGSASFNFVVTFCPYVYNGLSPHGFRGWSCSCMVATVLPEKRFLFFNSEFQCVALIWRCVINIA